METSGMRLVPEKVFDFYVNISGTAAASNGSQTIGAGYAYNSSSIQNRITQEKPADKSGFYALVILLVVIISIILYRRTK